MFYDDYKHQYPRKSAGYRHFDPPPYNFTCICYFIYYIVISTIRAVKFIARLTKAAKWRKVRLKPVSVSIKVL